MLIIMTLQTESRIMITANPHYATYQRLRMIHSQTLQCPCARSIISHREFISLSAQLHQVCSSNLTSDRWISLLREIRTNHHIPDWRNTAVSQFQLLSDLCQLAKTTINDAVQRLLFQSFVVADVLTESEFEARINATMNQFFRATLDYYGILIKTINSVIQVDQPYFGPIRNGHVRGEVENPVGRFVSNRTNGIATFQVRPVFSFANMSTRCLDHAPINWSTLL